jgi:glutaconyl-CoA/methylmalonyl-CoA decarboxylase subunit gamma
MSVHRFKIEGKSYQVEVGARAGNSVLVTVNGTPFAVELEKGAAEVAPPAPASPAGALPPAAPPVAATPVAGGFGEVRAPIPGVVLSLRVAVGQRVEAKTQVVVLEAMKMENEIFAGVAGVVESIAVQPQQEVRQGDLLVRIQPA